MAEFLAAVDAGTTEVKASVFDVTGRLRAEVARPLDVHCPNPGWVEQDASQMATTAADALRQAVSEAGLQGEDIAALGITNQRSSVVAWDAETLEPLGPLIVWQDNRTADRCLELQSQGLFINPLMAASKAEWLLLNVPAVAEAGRRGTLKFGTPESWLAARLCGGVHVGDHGNASATGLYAHFEYDWDSNALGALKLERDCMPSLVDSSGPAAKISGDVLPGGAALAGMTGDQQAALFGMGCMERGATKCSYGTSAMITANSGEGLAMGGAGTYPILAWRRGDAVTYSVEGNVVTAGAAMQWLTDNLGILPAVAESSALAESVSDSGGTWAIPAFQGLGTPQSCPDARAMIGGLSRSSEPAHIVRAMLEGVTQRVTDVAVAVWEGTGEPAALRVDGGMSRNDFLLQRQADLLGIPVERSAVVSGAAAGAAGLAAVGVGLWDDMSQAEQNWKAEAVFEPTWDAARRDAERERWGKLVQLAVDASAVAAVPEGEAG